MLTSLEFNPVSLILLVPVIIILINSLFIPFTHERIQNGLYSFVNSFEFIASLIIALLLTKNILFDRNNEVYEHIYELLPKSVKASLVANNIYTYICIAFIILIIVVLVIRLITYPLYKLIFERLSYSIYSIMSTFSSFFRRIISFILSIPKAFVTLIFISFILYFFSYYFTVPGFSKYIDDSKILNTVYDTALRPVIDSDIAKKIPVILNDSFNVLELDNENNNEIAENIREKLDNYNIKVIQYYNGVTLEDAIKSTPEIDKMAVDLVKNEKNDYDKCKKIYEWITKNISYDYEKSKTIAKEARNTKSGTIICYQTRKGICFDYASLFISMCKANSIKANLVTGMGFSGMAWGDHAWNQFYYEKEKRWVNVDTTFGVSGVNYFDTNNFSLDHKNSKVHNES